LEAVLNILIVARELRDNFPLLYTEI
jgi:hypothetical protein